MLYIDPVDCIDCEACVPECPVEAIFAEANVPAQWTSFTPAERREVRRPQGARRRPHHREAGRQGRAGVQEEVSSPRSAVRSGEPSSPLVRCRLDSTLTADHRLRQPARRPPHPARHPRRPHGPGPAPLPAPVPRRPARHRGAALAVVVHPQPLHPAAPARPSPPPSTPASGTPRPARRCCTTRACQTEAAAAAAARRAGPLRHAGRQPAGRRRRPRDDRRRASSG